MKKPKNFILVISDTLRPDYLGCYGNKSIQTPNIDAFASQSFRFDRAYPESLPTIPVRRALHTGRRAYPFKDYKPVKWDTVYLPGWQAMDNEEDTLAENLAEKGFHTGFVTDTLPNFAPGFNFQRGFWQWEYIRGQQQDRWRSPYTVPKEHFKLYGGYDLFKNNMYAILPMHLANTKDVKTEEDTTTAKVFKWAMGFLEDNKSSEKPFYLLVDCFDPHEPWEAPKKYYDIYGDKNYNGRKMVHCKYGPASNFGYTDKEIEYVRAQYCGLVTLVDTWFGKFIKKLDELGLNEDTAVFFISDHGTNFCDNPRDVIGKPSNAMYPGVMNLSLLIRLPDGNGSNKVVNEMVYNIDVSATIYDLTGVQSKQEIHGQSLIPLIKGQDGWKKRQYLTSRYGHDFWYIDDKYYILADIDGIVNEIFDLENDPTCKTTIADKVSKKVFKSAWDRIVKDAGGKLPDYRKLKHTDAIGQKEKGKYSVNHV